MNPFQYILSFISPIILEKLKSDVNGSIVVEYAYGAVRLRVDGYIESGTYSRNMLAYIFPKFNFPVPKTALLLGVGGGSMLSFLHTTFPDTQLTGVELDPVMLDVAKKYFGLSTLPTQLITANAIDFVTDHRQSYDLIVDDLFIGCDRPLSADNAAYYQAIVRLLTDQGVYIQNRSILKRYREQSELVSSQFTNYFLHTHFLPRSPNLFLIGSNYPMEKRL